MNIICLHCHTHHWLDERLKDSPISSPRFNHCCHHGRVRLERLPDPPEQLRSLFTAQSTKAKEFRERIRQYNAALAFTSFTAKETNDNSAGGGPWLWKTGYTIYHRAGALLPNTQEDPKYAQLYFYDPVKVLDYWMKRNKKLKCDTMEYLQNLLIERNHYTQFFLHAFEILHRTPSSDLAIEILADPSTDLRRYNVPTEDEIAVVLPGQQTHAVNPRNIILHQRHVEGNLQFIHDHHHAYAPLHYVLLFPYGTAGWSYGIPLHANADTTSNDDTTNMPSNEKHISQVQYYSSRLHTQQDEFPIL